MPDSESSDHSETRTCPICREQKSKNDFVSGVLLRPSVVELIKRDHPRWSVDDVVCSEDLHRYRMAQVHELVHRDQTELTRTERDVLEAIGGRSLVSENVDASFEEKLSLGELAADRLSNFGGSWTFLGLFALFLGIWVLTNAIALTQAFDPYPFILLNLVLSCLAAIQAPIIMMSQNRQEAKDRARSEHDYEVNLKAELEIRQLHEKLDNLLLHQWHRLMELQEVQAELIEDLKE
ncbi:DUF1003 domain-containing protein [Halorarius litoreus]|uniref:DUF1003 domain-containing protein n=1 Tax=Halorarius litoreus TaxID=2962676 RepID=UPI0020CC4F03|nr:DUF1003 domain-containing protein [Halorarius litoreus]